MDAGVPLKRPTAGIAMGLILEDKRFAVLSDILGDEDHLGDMDFKVAGTDQGITSLQMDIKIAGITEEIMKVALGQAKDGRMHILGEMAKALTAARAELGEHAPRIEMFKIPTDKIREVIGTGGKVIREIVEKTGAKINIEDDGSVKVASANGESIKAAINWIKSIASEAEVGHIYEGTVVKVMDFGAFVNFFGAKDGLVHISQLATRRVQKTSDVVKEGDKVKVKLLGFDDRGKVRLSMQVVDQETGEDLEAKQKAEGEPPRRRRSAERSDRFVFGVVVAQDQGRPRGRPFCFEGVTHIVNCWRATARRRCTLWQRASAPFAALALVHLERVGMRHGDDVVAGIDEMDVAGDAGRQIRKQIERGAADLLERHAAPQRRVALLESEHLARIADAGAGERADRPRRDRIDADRRRPEIDREIAHRRLQRRLGDAHDVVVRHRAQAAVIGERHHGAARRHQRRRALGDLGEGEAGDHHRAREIRARGVGVAALELVLVGEGDGVDQEIERAPFLARAPRTPRRPRRYPRRRTAAPAMSRATAPAASRAGRAPRPDR